MERKFRVGKTTYQRSKRYGIGKEIGGKIYVHKKYTHRVLSIDTLYDAIQCVPIDFLIKSNCVMYDPKRHIVRFDEAPDFDTAREPHVGDFIEVNIYSGKTRHGHSNYIWHHKWMWVDDDYDGFDVEESYQWSKKWTSIITHPSGSKRIWLRQIREVY